MDLPWGGCEIALVCDMRIASENARLGQPEITLGIIPGSGGTQRLQRLIGLAKAKELIFTGEVIDAQTALQIGLVNRVVPLSSLMGEAEKLAKKMVDMGRVALGLAKAAMNWGARVSLGEALHYEIECFSQCFATQDQKEDMAAFLEKRKPQFQGE
jgi:enoyl-CoA hydratase